VFNNGQASVYVYHNGPEHKVFMDARLEVSSRETFEKYDEIRNLIVQGDRRWTELARGPEGELPAVLLDSWHSHQLATGLLKQPEWRLVYSDQSGSVFIESRLADALQLREVPIAPNPEQREMLRLLGTL
jgi:hypothetical protein